MIIPVRETGATVPASHREERFVSLVVWMMVFLIGCSRGEPLPNGYAVFFASGSETSLVKPATKGGQCVVGPHIAEFGHSGNYIFGRIEPRQNSPPHPDHAPGFFVINSTTDEITTGLDHEKWLTELAAVGIDSPQLHPAEQKWPKTF
jgi:hypothetical protein